MSYNHTYNHMCVFVHTNVRVSVPSLGGIKKLFFSVYIYSCTD